MFLAFLYLFKQLGSKGTRLIVSATGALFLGAFASYFRYPDSLFSQLATDVLLAAYAFIAFDGKWYMRLLHGIVPPLLLFGCDRIADLLMYLITPENVLTISSLSTASYERELLYVFLCVLTFIPISNLNSRDNRHIPVFQRILLILLLVAGIAAMAVLTMAIASMSSRYSENPIEGAVRMCMFVAATILFMYVGVMFLFYNTADMYKKNYEMRMKAERAQLEEAHDKNMQETYDTIRTWRHDLKNHIRTIRSMAESGSVDDVIAYIDEAYDKIDAVTTYVSTGHPAVDAAISNKLFAAKNQNVKAETLISLPDNLPVSNVDMCAVLSNLLDNALRGALKTPAPKLRLEMSVRGRMLCIRVTNSADGEYKIHDGIFLSTKDSSENHGLGLRSVRKIVDSCGGYMKIEPCQDSFTVTVMLPLGMEG